MLEELEFVSGNPEHLVGRCILYTHNLTGTENPFNPTYPTLAVASDPSELGNMLSSILPFPDDLRETLMEKLKESNELWNRTMFGHHMYRSIVEVMNKGIKHLNLPQEMIKEIENELANIREENLGSPLQGCFLPLIGFDPDVIEPYKGICDIIKAPEVSNITYAGLVLAGHAQHYLASYFMQREKALVEKTENKGSNMPNLKDLPKQEFLKLIDRKVSELMYEHETGISYDQTLRDLQKLTSGSYLLRDVLNLSRLAQTGHKNKIEMMELYLKRVHLLINEKYEDIPEIDRKIQKLDQEEKIQ